MNHALNRLAIRLGMLGVAVASGALAVSQAQKGLQPETLSAGQEQQFAADAVGVLPASSLVASRGAAANSAMPAPIPLGASQPDSESTASPYSNEVIDDSPANTGSEYDNSVYGAADDPGQPATLPPPLHGSNLNQSVPPLAYDLPPAPPASAPSETQAQYLQAADSRYAPVQSVQAELTDNDTPPPPLDPPAAAYPDVHDGTESVAASPRPLPIASQQAEAVESNPVVGQEVATAAGNDDMYPLPAEDADEPFAPADDTLMPAPADDQYQGDATFQMPAERRSMPGTTDSAARSQNDLFGDTQPMTEARTPADMESLNEPAATGNGQPGPEELIGLQTPSLSIRKSAPTEAQVGKPTRLEIVVRNVGKIAAHDVLIRDEVPRGTRLIDTTPAAGATADGGILWQIGTIEPNAEVTVSMNVMPLEEGEIGSVATISFQVAATARSVVTRPVLLLEHSGPQQVLVGRDVVFQIRLANTGTGVATNVHLEEDVPDGLRHFDGRELEFRIGTLKPGESRMLELKLTADKPGIVTNTLVARGDSKLRVKDEYEFEVVAPLLQLTMEGPHKRFLDRKAVYQISMANPGTAPAQNVEMTAKLPPSLKFVSANNAGHYDSGRHAVVWSLEALPPQEMGTVELTVLPVQMGHFPLRVDAKANMNLSDSLNYEIEIEGMAALLYTVTDVNDPIEVGGDTTYEIQVINQGSKASTNLQLAALVPDGMELIRGDGPARAQVDGSRILFDPLPRLAPHGDVVYRIYVRGVEPGDKRIQVKLKSDDLSQPVTKEESTHVYSDE